MLRASNIRYEEEKRGGKVKNEIKEDIYLPLKFWQDLNKENIRDLEI